MWCHVSTYRTYIFTEIAPVLLESIMPFSHDPPQKVGWNQDEQLDCFPPSAYQYILEVKSMAHYVSG